MRLLYCIDILPRDRTRLRRIMTTSIVMAAIFSLVFGLLPTWPTAMAMQVCRMQELTNGVGLLPAFQFCFVIVCFIAIFISYIVLAVNVHYYQIESSFGKKDILTLKTLVIVSLVFILSFLFPYLGLVLPKPTNPKAVRILFTFYRSFLFTQSFLNPIIFYINNQTYREYVHKLYYTCRYKFNHPVAPIVHIEEPSSGRRIENGVQLSIVQSVSRMEQNVQGLALERSRHLHLSTNSADLGASKGQHCKKTMETVC